MSEGTQVTGRGTQLRLLLRFTRGQGRTLLVATLCLLVAAGLNLVYPTLIGEVIDALSEGAQVGAGEVALRAQATDQLNRSVSALVGLFALMGLATSARAYLFTVAGERVVISLRGAVFKALLSQEQALFDVTTSGAWVSRLSDDCAKVQSALTVNLSMLARYVIGAVGALIALSLISLKLTLVMIAVVPVTVVAAALYGRALRRLSREVQGRLSEANSVAQEGISGVKTVRAFGREAWEVERYHATLERTFTLARRRAKLGATFQGGVSFASYTSIAAVVWYGGHLTLEGSLSLGSLTAFMLYTFTLAFSVGALSGLWEDFSKALGASEALFELLSRRPALEGGPERLPPEGARGALRFEGVSFSYPSRPEVEVLKGFTLSVAPQQMIALVGGSGGGKSTIAALIERQYDPQVGQISLDGHPLTALSLESLRGSLGIVSQEPLLFSMSLRENIRYGRLEASDEEVEEAARAANAHEFICGLPQGYDTEVGERGARLSGGQRQRVAIARALLKDPRLLILDEATSALDVESERLVQEALERLMEGRTTLVIAHRLSTIRSADLIVVLERGEVVEQGTHEELLKAGGRYQALALPQLEAGE